MALATTLVAIESFLGGNLLLLLLIELSMVKLHPRSLSAQYLPLAAQFTGFLVPWWPCSTSQVLCLQWQLTMVV